jgi:DnaJ-class molecular chaperone
VKAGIKPKAIYTFHGEGHSLPGKKPGNAIFILEENPDPDFTRSGCDLIYRQSLSLYSGYDAFEMPTTRILGYNITFPIPAMTIKNNAVKEKRFPGVGFPIDGDLRKRGDLVSFLLKF